MALLAAATIAPGRAGEKPRTFEAALVEIVTTESGLEAAAEVRRRLDGLQQSLRASGKSLTPWFFEDAGFAGIALPAEAADLPTALETLRSRRGPCLPLVAIYLALAERTGVSAVPVATPRHVFIRETGAGGPCNVELLEHGAAWPDVRYLHQEKAPLGDPRARMLLRELSPKGLLAHLLNNHAVRLRAQGKVGDAGKVYRRALSLDPDCQPCHFNFANLLAAEAKREKARWHYDRALKLHPWDGEAMLNRQTLLTAASPVPAP